MHPNLLVGMESASDASIYRLTDEIAIVQSLDFFTPIVDNPYEFGQIAAANSLSDIYAMGGRPITALNIVCFPIKELDSSILKEILCGGIDKVHEAGGVVVGGHSVEDKEPKYGLSVTGIVHPENFVTNKGARPGDTLILTKPIGTGVLATAYKGRLVGEDVFHGIVSIMSSLNRGASEAMMEVGVNGATDITGFGLIGHALEMAEASSVTIELEAGRVPIIPEALDLVNMGMIPEGDYANKRFCERKVVVLDEIASPLLDLLFDAQTSGGLLISVSQEKAPLLMEKLKDRCGTEFAMIGRVLEGPPRVIVKA